LQNLYWPPTLKKRQVGQHLSNDSNGKKLYQMGMATSFNETMKCKSLKLNTTNLEYWATKGLNQRMQELSSGLWCDGSASIIMSRLTQQPKFTSPLTVVEQGNAKRSGHWWIIANLEKENPSYKGPFGRNAFTIDIWGALSLRYTAPPTTPYYNDGAIAIDHEKVGKVKKGFVISRPQPVILWAYLIIALSLIQ